jgi:hypothetical protein
LQRARQRTRRILLAFAALAVLAAVGVFIGTHMGGGIRMASPPPDMSEYCTADADGSVTLGLDQMANAATITAVGVRRDMPERAVIIALATAMQESRLDNLRGGDRDSIGLFQQRPSQGWGTAAQVSDARYATGKFYSALMRVRNWEKMTVTQAAQAVQRSALPDAYQQWTPDATVLARALLGDESAAVACVVHGAPPTTGTAALSKLSTSLQRDWGSLVKQVAAGGPNVLALAVPGSRAGWQYAHWLVANAQHSGIMRVRYGNQQWTAGAGHWGTAPAVAASGVTVFANANTSTVVAEVFGT